MSSDPVSIWSSQTFTSSGLSIIPGQAAVLAVSAPIANGPTARNSLSLSASYESIVPNITAGSPPFTVGLIVEGEEPGGLWVPIAYQFSPYRNSEGAQLRIIRLQPDISDYNTGIDDSVFPVNSEIARISRQQGRLPDSNFRVKLLLVDNDPTGPNAFVSVTVSCSGERYNA